MTGDSPFPAPPGGRYFKYRLPGGPLLADSPVRTTQLLQWLERIRAGDLSAREVLLQQTSGRLLRLARKMLRRFGRLRRWVDPEDVLQSATLRLLRALQALQPDSTDRFFGLAAEQ